MKFRKPSFAIISVLFAALLSSSTKTLNARDADLPSVTLAAAQTSKKCTNLCRARYHDCQKLNQIPIFECQYIYQDCMRYTCNAAPG
jgi:hypothetical protein